MEARTLNYGDIGWAINHARLGHKMRRKNWPAGTCIELDANSQQIILTPADQQQPIMLYVAPPADLTAGDWEMLEPTLPGTYKLET